MNTIKQVKKLIDESFELEITLNKTIIDKINDEYEYLENALDEIENILNKPQFEYDNIPCNYEDEIFKLKEIIKKAKGE